MRIVSAQRANAMRDITAPEHTVHLAMQEHGQVSLVPPQPLRALRVSRAHIHQLWEPRQLRVVFNVPWAFGQVLLALLQ